MTMTSRVWPVASFEEALPPRLENVLRQRAPYSLVQQPATSFFSEISLESCLSLWRIRKYAEDHQGKDGFMFYEFTGTATCRGRDPYALHEASFFLALSTAVVC